MKEDIKVSIIVPIYNADKYLRRCLDSLVQQSMKEIEILCIDDASTDDSHKIVQQYAVKDKRIKVLHSSGNESTPKNMGQSAARNVGLKAASGEYILMVDADDWLELDAAEELYFLSSKERLDILYYGFYPEYESEELRQEYEGKVNHTRGGACIDEVISGQAMLVLQFENRAVCGTIWSAMFRRLFLKDAQILFNEEIRMEDSLFSLQAILCAERTKCSPKAYYHYYRRYMSVTTTKFSEKQLMDLFMMAVGEFKVALSLKSMLPELPKYIAKWVGGDFAQVHKIWNNNLKFIEEKKLVFSHPWQNIAFEIFRFIAKPEPALHKFTANEIHRIKQSDDVIVYGAGYVSGRVLTYLHQLGVDKFKIAVTKKKQDFFMGNTIYTIHELCRKSSDSIILLAVMPDKQTEMIDMLDSLGVHDYICMV